MVRKWSTEDIEPHEQFSYWNEAVCEELLNFELGRRNSGPFQATLTSLQVGSIAINQARSDEHTGSLTQYRIGRSAENYFLLHIQTSSKVIIQQHGCETTLCPGDALLLDSLYPFHLDFPKKFDCYSVKIPRKELRPLLNNPIKATVSPILARSPLGQSVSHYIRFLETISSDKPSNEQISLILNNLLGLIAVGTSASADGREAGHQGWQASKALRIKHFILANLDDPELTPIKIANQMNISTSYLHKIFAREQQTVGNFIREQRLRQTAMALRDERNDHYTISELALRYGFNDLSNFWRSFRQRFDMTPREFRVHH